MKPELNAGGPAGPGLDHSTPVPNEVPSADSARAAKPAVVVIDPAFEGPVTNAPANTSKVKSPATPEQVAQIESRVDAVKAMLAEGYVKGKVVEAFVNGRGPATDLSEAQAKRIIDRLNQQAPTVEKIEAPVVGEDGASLDAPEPPEMLDGERDPHVEPENNYTNQPASDASKNEAHRLLFERKDQNGAMRTEVMAKTHETLQNWVIKGAADIGFDGTKFDLGNLTKGQFQEVQAAAQSASIQALTQGVDFEALRQRGNFKPETVRDSINALVDGSAAKLKLPEQVTAALKSENIRTLLDASRQINSGLSLRVKEAEANGGHKPTIYDFAPNLEVAAKYAIKKGGDNLTVESATADMTEALTAGTRRQLYRVADAQGVNDFARLDIRNPEAAAPKAARTPDWAAKPITNSETIEQIKANFEANGYVGMPGRVKDKLEAGTSFEKLTQGDAAELRKAGYIPAAPANGLKRGDLKAPLAGPELDKVLAVANEKTTDALSAGLTSGLISKIREASQGKDVKFNGFDYNELSKKNLL